MDIGSDVAWGRQVATTAYEDAEIVGADAVPGIEPRRPIGQVIDLRLRDDQALVDYLSAEEHEALESALAYDKQLDKD